MVRGRKSELYYEEIGENFAKFMSSYDVARRVALIHRLIPADRIFDHALEVGCGTGEISRTLAGRTRDLTVSDISEALARQAGERSGCSWSRQDACQLTFPGGRFDLVVSSECIEHTPDPRRALSEMARVLAPGGLLVVTTPNRLWFPTLLLAQALRLRRFQGNEYWIFASQARLVLQRAGLSIRKTSGCHLFPWQLPGARRLLPFFDRFGDTLSPVMINFAIAAERPLERLPASRSESPEPMSLSSEATDPTDPSSLRSSG